MTKEELLRVYSAYLPYLLHVQSQQTGTIYQLNTFSNMRGQGVENRDIESVLNGNFKPVLYDLSYLTKEIEHEGEVVVLAKKIFKREWQDIAEYYVRCNQIMELSYDDIQLLLKHHFNVFNLPEGEYINKATLKTK